MNEDIDSKLRGWAARNEPPAEHLTALAARIAADGRRALLAGTDRSPQFVPVSVWGRLAYAGLGAALATAVLLLSLRGRPVPRSGHAAGADASALATISARQAETGRKLFDEMERLFSSDLRWVVQSDGDVGIGVESLPGGPLRDAPPLLARLVVVSRRAGETAWTTIWKTDVLLRGEEVVEVVPNHAVDNRLVLWVYPLADGKLAVDTTLSLREPLQVSSRLNTVLPQGQPAEVFSFRSGDMEYRLFQTVEALGRQTHG
jgi:hypothetical protein